jgi:hypothetical protein
MSGHEPISPRPMVMWTCQRKQRQKTSLGFSVARKVHTTGHVALALPWSFGRSAGQCRIDTQDSVIDLSVLAYLPACQTSAAKFGLPHPSRSIPPTLLSFSWSSLALSSQADSRMSEINCPVHPRGRPARLQGSPRIVVLVSSCYTATYTSR